MLPASLLAAASLANSLEVYGKDVWPVIIQQYSAYTLADITKARQQIKAVRLTSAAAHAAHALMQLLHASNVRCQALPSALSQNGFPVIGMSITGHQLYRTRQAVGLKAPLGLNADVDCIKCQA